MSGHPYASSFHGNRMVHQHSSVPYNVSQAHHASTRGSLVDRGANGGICGDDAVIIHEYDRHVDVTGIDDHALKKLRIVNAASYQG